MFTGLGAVSHVTVFSMIMAHIPGGDSMCKLIHRMQAKWGLSVKRPQVRKQKVFPSYFGGNNNYRHKQKYPEAIVNMTDLTFTKEIVMGETPRLRRRVL